MKQAAEDERKRAENLVWTAGADYAFTPLFLSFTEDGQADLYMNLVIGFMHKWLGKETEALLTEVSESRRAALLTDTLWLGIESYVYARELPERPALSALRLQHAREFFQRIGRLNRQQWMAENKRLLDQQMIRWGRVLGKETHRYAPDRRALSAALELSPTLPREEAAAALRDILIRFFGYRGPAELRPLRLRLPSAEAWALRFLLKTEHQHTDTVMMKNTRGPAADGTAASDDKHSGQHKAGDIRYIRACFGRSLYTDEELQQLEQGMLGELHRGCHIYVTDGHPAAEEKETAEMEKLRQDRALQEKANRRYFTSQGMLPDSLVRRLAARLTLILSELRQTEAVRAPAGRLDASRAWRLPLVHDLKVFEKQRPEQQLPIDVTLLLDASASRGQQQEEIAAEAWILTKALRLCRVSCATWCFRSLRGYTVLEKLSDFRNPGSDALFQYYAAGWNRDGLGLRLAGEELLRQGTQRRHILIVLTDGSPDDSVRIPPCSSFPLGTAYEGRAAAEDAAAAAAELRKAGILVYGLFLGRTENLDTVRRIYGKYQTRIHALSQFARAAGEIFVKAAAEL